MSRKRKKKQSRAVTALLIVLLVASCCIFVWSGYTIVERMREYSASRDEYAQLRNQFKNTAAPVNGAPEPSAGAAQATDTPGTAAGTSAPAGATDVPTPAVTREPIPLIDFSGLKAENPDTVGWIEIPDTDISYPVVQAKDNDKYLTHSFNGEKNSSGAIFLDAESQSDMMGMHTIIYGHHMRDGSMFAQLVNFKDADFFAAHDGIVLYTPERTLRLTVIAAYAQKADNTLRQFHFADAEELSGFIQERAALSANVREGVDLSQATRLYSFVTCSYESSDVRTVVHAVELP